MFKNVPLFDQLIQLSWPS